LASILPASPSGASMNDLLSDRSTFQKPGPGSELRPRLPAWPGAGALTARLINCLPPAGKPAGGAQPAAGPQLVRLAPGITSARAAAKTPPPKGTGGTRG